jgi:hypothetical protein
MDKTLHCILLFIVAAGLANAVMSAPLTIEAGAGLSTRSLTAPRKPGEVLPIDGRILVGGGQTGYVAFPTASLGKTTPDKIRSATLRLYLPYDAKNTQGNITLFVRSIAADAPAWDDSGKNPVPCETFTPSVSRSGAVSVVVKGDEAGSNRYCEWDVTDLVKKLLATKPEHPAQLSFQVETRGGIFRFNGHNGRLAPDSPPQLVIETDTAS